MPPEARTRSQGAAGPVDRDIDLIDRRIIERLQGGFPLSEHPYAEVAEALGTDEATLIARIHALLDCGVLSRFGPMYHAERMGGALTLCAMAVPPRDLDRVAALVNAHPEVAHNYERVHALNMWFVLATEQPQRAGAVIDEIERETGLAVIDLPKLDEYYVGLELEVQVPAENLPAGLTPRALT